MARPDELTDDDRRYLGEYLRCCDNEPFLVIKILTERLQELMNEQSLYNTAITPGTEQTYHEAFGEDADEAIKEHKRLKSSWRR